MLNFDIQNHRPLREMVYEELKMQILTGTITVSYTHLTLPTK